MPSGSKIIIVCSHLIGRARATCEFARRLVADGQNVSFVAPKRVHKHLEQLGKRIVEIDEFKLGGPTASRRSGLRDFLPSARRARLREMQAHLDIGKLEQLIETEVPDLVLLDFEMHPHIIAALGTGARVALFTDIFITRPSATSPPVHVGIVPGAGQASKVRQAWAQLWLSARKKRLKRWKSTAGADYLNLLRLKAADRKVPLKRLTTRWWWQVPFAWDGLPLLIMQGKAVDFSAPPHQNMHHVGPMVPEPTPASPEDRAVLAIAEQAKSDGKRVVYITFGSLISGDAQIVERLWQAVDSCPDVVAIHTMGGHLDGVADKVPENVHLVGWAPQDQLLYHCDAAIIHVGVNTMIECIAAHTPMLCIPRGVDCEGNTARVVYHQLGIAATQNASAEEIHQKLRKLLDDPSYAPRCEAIFEQLDTYRDAKTAETVVRNLISVPK